MNKNAIALHPPMGWNSYDYYDTNVTENEVLANAEVMAKELKNYGWEYIVVDIQWYAYHTATMRDQFQYIPFGKCEMDGFGRLLPCPDKFPSSAEGAGFGPLAEKIHAMGLKFGIHIMRGIPRMAAHLHLPIVGSDMTADMVADPSSVCPWNPDMYGVRNTSAGQAYYDSIFRLYAQWGVDFIKCDDICAGGFGPQRTYERRHEVEMIHKAIENCGRPMVLSLSPGPAILEESWHYKKYANMWRMTDDFWDDWSALRHMFERCEKWQDHRAPGCYPDCDMLPLGIVGKCFGEERWTRLNREEQKTMMSLWCIFGSPLMLGAELTKLDIWTKGLIQKEELLRLLRGDFVSKQVCRDSRCCIWVAYDGKTQERYIALFNLQDEEMEIAADLQKAEEMAPEGCWQEAGDWKEIWSCEVCHEPVRTIAPHGVALLRG